MSLLLENLLGVTAWRTLYTPVSFCVALLGFTYRIPAITKVTQIHSIFDDGQIPARFPMHLVISVALSTLVDVIIHDVIN